MSVKATALAQAIRILDALKCEYAIIDENGDKHGELEVVEKKKRSAPVFPRGEVRSYILPFIKDLGVGDTVKIDAGGFGLERVRGNVGSWMIGQYGPGSCTTTISHKDNTVEVLRIY